MSRKTLIVIITALLLGIGLVVSLMEAFSEAYVWISLYVIIVAMIPFYVRLEMKAWNHRHMIIIAMMAAIAAASRIPFASLPSVTPTSFVIIASALVLGAEAGFLIGATAAFVSNIMLGQGPWTPWQMFAWGMMGFTAGLLSNSVLRTVTSRLLFGFIWGFVFGWLMNISYIVGFVDGLSWHALLTAGVLSFYFDLIHGLTNVILLIAFGKGWMRVLNRYKQKYEPPQIQKSHI
jgi:energy-coupling factor transport system substrate-specific component